MKKSLFCFLLSFLLIKSSIAQEVVISGMINDAQGKTLYLEGFEKATTVKLDSVLINKKGKFQIKRDISTTDFFKFSFTPNDFFVLILQPGEKVYLTADAKNLSTSYSITGSEHSQNLKDFVGIVNDYIEERDSLQALVKQYAADGDQQNASKINMEMTRAYDNFIKARNQFINEHPESPALLGALNHLNQNTDLEQYKKIEAALAASMPGSQYHESVKALVASLEQQRAQAEKQQREQQMAAAKMAPGQPAPEINMQDKDGNPLPLSSLKGKYVLIDFWASWCGPCRKENPNVVEAYNKYKDKGFTVYSVSIDNARDRWLAAIEADQLIWPNHVSSLQGWQTPILQDYGVRGIPFTVLIDTEGKIIQTNLRGPALEQKLTEIFGF